MAPRDVVVFSGGPGPDAPLAVPAGAFVIAADSGADVALARGIAVDLAVGDFDSVTPAGLAALEAAGTRLERHPVAKDASDLELALDHAIALEPERILVIGGAAGRLDHLAGELLLVAAGKYAAATVDAQLGAALVHVVRGKRTLTGTPGELVSLFAVHGPATGVVTEGLEYALDGETLHPGSTRGLSNVFVAADATVCVEAGVLLGIRPGRTAAAGS
jgi:thiamine pyrophosphokinase